MNVQELIDKLKAMPHDVPVVGMWDSSWSRIESVTLIATHTEGTGAVVELNVETWGSYER